jgi:hypothetical protein
VALQGHPANVLGTRRSGFIISHFRAASSTNRNFFSIFRAPLRTCANPRWPARKWLFCLLATFLGIFLCCVGATVIGILSTIEA